MDVVEPVDVGDRGGFPPSPGPEPEAQTSASAHAIGHFLAVVRRRFALRGALKTCGYGVGALAAVLLLRPAARAIATAVAGVAAVIAAAALSPAMARGLRTLVHTPSLFEGAAVSDVALIGDVRITYSYPGYTGLPPRTVEGSTGDV